ncbi:MAG TPA: lipopolysaccharide biosynthesis protein, partial [Luteitalea sp.]|nr:lipopolysaccharide biosynthesis protein [Luteitalea sp.]
MTDIPSERITPKNLNRAVKRGMVWLAVERGGLQAINLITSAVLARLLGPAAFGIMGMSALFTGISRRLVNLGFGAAVIRRKEIRPDHLSTLFVLTMIVNTSICLALVAASPFAGRYFDNPLVGEVLRWMSLVFVLRAVGTVPSAVLRRRLDFESNAYASFVDAIAKLLVSVPLAWKGYGVWALVYGELAGSIADKLFLAWRAGWIPSLRVTRSAIDDLFVFGMTMSVRGVVGYVAENADNLVVGKVLGMSALGFYEKSYNLMRMPVAELSSRLGAVLFPALARIQDEPGRFRAAFRKSLLGMSLLGFPLFATLVVLGGPVIAVLYGPRWLPAVLPFQILCVSGPLRMTAQLSTSAIDACGNLRQDLWRRFVGLG